MFKKIKQWLNNLDLKQRVFLQIISMSMVITMVIHMLTLYDINWQILIDLPFLQWIFIGCEVALIIFICLWQIYTIIVYALDSIEKARTISDTQEKNQDLQKKIAEMEYELKKLKGE